VPSLADAGEPLAESWVWRARARTPQSVCTTAGPITTSGSLSSFLRSRLQGRVVGPVSREACLDNRGASGAVAPSAAGRHLAQADRGLDAREQAVDLATPRRLRKAGVRPSLLLLRERRRRPRSSPAGSADAGPPVVI